MPQCLGQRHTPRRRLPHSQRPACTRGGVSMGTNAELYDQDFYAWVQEQAALLKARQFDAIDLDNLIEEVESLARQERHLLWHRFRTLLTHLVAWWGEIPAHCI